MTDHRSPSEPSAALARALTCLGAYGAKRNAWPSSEQGLYDSVADDSQFQDALREASALDATLAGAAAPQAGAALESQILAAFPPARAKSAGLALFGGRLSGGFGRLIPAGALAGLTALGFAIGAASAGVTAQSADSDYYYDDTSVAVVFSEDDAFWRDEG